MNQIKRRRIQHESIQTKRDDDDDDYDDDENDDDDVVVEKNENENVSQNDAFSQTKNSTICVEINVFIYLWNFIIVIKNHNQFS